MILKCTIGVDNPGVENLQVAHSNIVLKTRNMGKRPSWGKRSFCCAYRRDPELSKCPTWPDHPGKG